MTQCKNRGHRPYIRGTRAVTRLRGFRKVCRAADVNRTTGGNVIIRRQNRGSAGAGHVAAVRAGIAFGSTGPDQLRFSSETGMDGRQVVSVTGELDIATAQQAYAYLSDVIDHGYTPVSVDLAGLTFCDASGLSVL